MRLSECVRRAPEHAVEERAIRAITRREPLAMSPSDVGGASRRPTDVLGRVVADSLA